MFTRRSPRRLTAWLLVGLLLLAQWLSAGHSIEHGRGSGFGPAAATALAQPASGDVGPAAAAGADADGLCPKCLLLSQLASVAPPGLSRIVAAALPRAWERPAALHVGSRTPVLARARGPPALLS